MPIPPARIALVYRERLTRMLECDAAIEALEARHANRLVIYRIGEPV